MPEASTPSSGPTRRQILLGAAATLVIAGCSSSSDSSSSTTAAPADGGSTAGSTGSTTSTVAEATTTTVAAASTIPADACVLTPELTAGPYHLEGHLNRADITDGRPGLPLEFQVQVFALPDCTPLPGAAVDIWHCDAGGEYSGFNGNSLEATAEGGTNDKRFLRGVQLTNDDGVATFTTIFPGWYEGRTVHIHLQVLEGGTLGQTYEGGHIAHVGQAFFDEALTAELLAVDPYRAHTGTRTTNDQDSIYGMANGTGMTTMTQRSSSDPSTGYVAKLACLIDPNATPPPAPLF